MEAECVRHVCIAVPCLSVWEFGNYEVIKGQKR